MRVVPHAVPARTIGVFRADVAIARDEYPNSRQAHSPGEVYAIARDPIRDISPQLVVEVAPHKKRDGPARTPMVRFAASQNVNKNNTSLMIMHEYTHRHVHVTSLDFT